MEVCLYTLRVTQPEMKEKFAQVFASKTQQEWTEMFSGIYHSPGIF